MDLKDYLDQSALNVASEMIDGAVIQDKRGANVPFMFLQYLNWAVKTNIYTSILDADNTAYAATVTDFNVKSKEGKRGDVSELILKKFPISQSYSLTELEILELKTALANTSGAKETVISQMFDDVARTKTAIYERLEFYFLQLMSTGKIVLNSTNNSDGLEMTVDYGVDSSQKIEASVAWDLSATADPIADIQGTVDDFELEGLFFDRIFMTKATFRNMVNSTKFKAYATLTMGAGAESKIIGLPQVNEVFALAGLPEIEIVRDAVYGLDSDGNRVKLEGWDTDYIQFGYSSMMGEITAFTPLTDMLESAQNTIFAVDREEGILTTVESDVNPPKVETASRTYAIPNMPQLYRCVFMKVDNL